MAELEREVARCDGDAFSVREFEVEITTEIIVGGFVSGGGAHLDFPVYVCKVMLLL